MISEYENFFSQKEELVEILEYRNSRCEQELGEVWYAVQEELSEND